MFSHDIYRHFILNAAYYSFYGYVLPNDANIEDKYAAFYEDFKEKYYIPLECSRNYKLNAAQSSVSDEIREFLSNSEQILIIAGDSGSGKTTACVEALLSLYEDFANDQSCPIPIYIRPAVLANFSIQGANIFTKLFERCAGGWNIDKDKRLVFIIDNYEEFNDETTLRETLRSYINAKFIITCLSNSLNSTIKGSVLSKYLKRSALRSIFIAPFSQNDIKAYLHKYITISQSNWSLNQYREALGGNTFLCEQASNALNLSIIAQTLPFAKTSCSTITDLFELYINLWFDRQGILIKDIKRETFFSICEELAFMLFIKDKVSYEKHIAIVENSEFTGFLYLENHNCLSIKTRSPLLLIGNDSYIFAHNAFKDYLIARKLFKDINNSQPENLNKKHLMNCPLIMFFLSEMRLNGTELIAEKNLITMLYSSAQYPIGASNAATILNAKRYAFSGMNLSGIEIANADLSGAVLDNTNLSKANLKGVNFTNAFLRKTNLKQSKMKDAKFGQLPYLKGHSAPVSSVAFTPDGRLLVSASLDNTVRLWNVENKKSLHTYEGHIGPVRSVAVSSDGSFIASSSSDNTIILWNIKERSLACTFKMHRGPVESISFSPDGDLLASGGSDAKLILWDIANKNALYTFEAQQENGSIKSVSFSPDGKLLSCADNDGVINIYTIEDKTIYASLQGHSGAVYSAVFSADGKYLVSGGWDETIRLWDIESKTLTSVIDTNSGFVKSISFSPDGKLISSGNWDDTVKLWDRETGSLVYSYEGHKGFVECVCFSPDGALIASSGWDNSIRLWDVKGKEFFSSCLCQNQIEPVYCVSFSPDARFVVSCGLDNAIRIWDIEIKRLAHIFRGHTGFIECVSYSSDGRLIASGSLDETVRLWDVEKRSLVHIFEGHSGSVQSVDFSPDGDTLASCGFDNTVKLWSIKHRTLLYTFEDHYDAVYCVKYSPEGKFIASSSKDNTIRLRDVINRKTVHTFLGHKDCVESISFSPDGRFIASGGRDNALKLWNVEDRTLVFTFNGHSGFINSVSFSPDGRRIFSSGCDNVIRLWNIEDKIEIAVFEGHSDAVQSVCISRDGKLLVSCGLDQSVRLWDVDRELLLWTSNQQLYCRGVNIKNATGLSANNQLLLNQLGAQTQ
ncbi:repeat-containing protein [Candidatus Magnetoovum chiemensis]|nr:repeat-containing protein [Candidatus Magnetoovum chiemensis]